MQQLPSCLILRASSSLLFRSTFNAPKHLQLIFLDGCNYLPIWQKVPSIWRKSDQVGSISYSLLFLSTLCMDQLFISHVSSFIILHHAKPTTTKTPITPREQVNYQYMVIQHYNSKSKTAIKYFLESRSAKEFWSNMADFQKN